MQKKSNTIAKYFFLARSTPGLENTLVKELESFNLKGKSLKSSGIHEIRFKASQQEMWKLLFYSHTLDHLKLQVGPEFMARGEKELVKGLHKLPWHSFLPFEKFNEYKLPEVRAKSFSSKLYHETKITELVEKFLNKLPAKFERHQEFLRQNTPQKASKAKKNLQQNSEEVQEETTTKEVKLKDLPTFYTYLSRNNALVAMNAVNESLHKHGFKNAIGWGSLRESIASSCLTDSEIITKAKETKTLKLWDPFCGGGTLLQEAFLMFMDVPIRSEFEEVFCFKDWPVFESKEFKLFKEQINEKLKNRTIPAGYNIQLFGCDINTRELNKSVINFKTAKMEEYTYEDSTHTVTLKNANPLIRTEKIGNVGYLIGADFEIAANVIGDLDGLNIITNIPYGVRSSKYIDAKELNAVYVKFGRFLRKNRKRLGEVFVICPEESDRVLGGFISISDMEWEKVSEFDNQGIKVALFKLLGNKKRVAVESEVSEGKGQEEFEIDMSDKADKSSEDK